MGSHVQYFRFPTPRRSGPFLPVVIAPKDVLVVATPRQARRNLALSLLSVIVHARGEKGPDVVYSAVNAAQGSDDAEMLGLCYVVVGSVLTQGLEQAIKAKIQEAC